MLSYALSEMRLQVRPGSNSRAGKWAVVDLHSSVHTGSWYTYLRQLHIISDQPAVEADFTDPRSAAFDLQESYDDWAIKLVACICLCRQTDWAERKKQLDNSRCFLIRYKFLRLFLTSIFRHSFSYLFIVLQTVLFMSAFFAISGFQLKIKIY